MTAPEPPHTTTRHYIGITTMGRVSLAVGPGEFPDGPVTLGDGSPLYPVSAEVAVVWAGDTLDDDDDPEDDG